MQSPILPLLEKLVEDSWVRLDQEQITPWFFLTAGPAFSTKDYYGKSISYQGVEFDGTPSHVFWGRYIEPFLEAETDRIIRATLRLAVEKRQPAKESLEISRGLLRTLINRCYARMQEVDQRLRGKGYPGSVQTRSVEAEVSSMCSFVQRRIDAEIAMLPSNWSLNKVYNDHPFWFWLIALAVGTLATILVA